MIIKNVNLYTKIIIFITKIFFFKVKINTLFLFINDKKNEIDTLIKYLLFKKKNYIVLQFKTNNTKTPTQINYEHNQIKIVCV